MKLDILIKKCNIKKIINNKECEIKDINYDSRKITKGSLFICLKGTKKDGHDYIEEAVKNGACAIIVQEEKAYDKYDVPVIIVEDTRIIMAHIAAQFYRNPCREVELIGVTGTNGKTTVVHYIKDVLEMYGRRTGVIGTLGYEFEKENIDIEKNTPTTPQALELQQVVRKFKNLGAEEVVMEVTSSALQRHRVEECKFKVGILTNISSDHLDEHKTIENYKKEKMKLFRMCENGVINIDDKSAEDIIKYSTCNKIVTYGIENQGDIYADNIKYEEDKVSFDVVIGEKSKRVTVNMPGKFTVYNALSCIACCYALNMNMEKVLQSICKVKKVNGRLEKVENKFNKNIIVDYAHTPVALEKLLFEAKKLVKGKIILVFGCGGERDNTKRSLMGMIAGVLANHVIITSDNPRNENPNKIIGMIEDGMSKISADYEKISDRREAIKRGISIMKNDDMLIIAGKGHEDYQIIGDKRIHFSDKEIVREILG